jgi:uncharacterized protein YecA (UPF0149 family)
MAKKTVGRNAPCHCGSGKKYKQCHGAHSGAQQKRGKWIAVAIGGALLLAALSFLNALSNQSPDDVQPGRVWSPEHGHYH